MCLSCPKCNVELEFQDRMFAYLNTTFYCVNKHALELDYEEHFDGEEETCDFIVVEATSNYEDHRV